MTKSSSRGAGASTARKLNVAWFVEAFVVGAG